MEMLHQSLMATLIVASFVGVAFAVPTWFVLRGVALARPVKDALVALDFGIGVGVAFFVIRVILAP